MPNPNPNSLYWNLLSSERALDRLHQAIAVVQHRIATSQELLIQSQRMLDGVSISMAQGVDEGRTKPAA